MRRNEVFLALILILAWTCPSFAETAQEFHVQGETAYKAKNYAKAVEAYTEALKLEPNRHETIYARGVNLFKLKKFDDALADFKKVTDITKIDRHALNYTGLIYQTQGNTLLALDAFEKASNLQKDNPTYALNAARVALKSGVLAKAESFYIRAASLSSDKDEAKRALRYIESKRAEAGAARAEQEASEGMGKFAAKYGFPPVYGHTAAALSDVFSHCSRRGLPADLGIQYLEMLGISPIKQSPGTVTYVYYQLPERPRHFYEVKIMEDGKVLGHHTASRMFAQP